MTCVYFAIAVAAELADGCGEKARSLLTSLWSPSVDEELMHGHLSACLGCKIMVLFLCLPAVHTVDAPAMFIHNLEQ